MGCVIQEDRVQVEEAIVRFLGDGRLTCRRIAEHIGKHPKTVYGYLRHMEETLGIVRKAGKVTGSGGPVFLWERCSHTEPLWGAKFVTDWPRGEHSRDPWDVALFGERRKVEAPNYPQPGQIDLLEGLD